MYTSCLPAPPLFVRSSQTKLTNNAFFFLLVTLSFNFSSHLLISSVSVSSLLICSLQQKPERWFFPSAKPAEHEQLMSSRWDDDPLFACLAYFHVSRFFLSFKLMKRWEMIMVKKNPPGFPSTNFYTSFHDPCICSLLLAG